MFKLKHFPGNPLSQYLQSLCSISKFSPPIKIEFTATPYFNLRLPVVEDNWVMGSPSNILRLFDSLIIPKYLLTICRSMIWCGGREWDCSMFPWMEDVIWYIFSLLALQYYIVCAVIWLASPLKKSGNNHFGRLPTHAPSKCLFCVLDLWKQLFWINLLGCLAGKSYFWIESGLWTWGSNPLNVNLLLVKRRILISSNQEWCHFDQ